VCKAAQEECLGIFTPLADGVLTNPVVSFPKENGGAQADYSPSLPDVILTHSVPSPWFALIGTHPDERIPHLQERPPTRLEVEYLIWLSIGRGAKGLVFRDTESDRLRRMLAACTGKVRQYLPELRYAIPVDSKDIARGKAHIAVLQAGHEQLIVIVTNNTVRYSPIPLTPASVEMLSDVHVDVHIPEGLQVAHGLHGSEEERPDSTGGEFSFTIDRFCHYHVCTIELERRGS